MTRDRSSPASRRSLFGAMTVLVRIALVTGVPPAAGTLLTIVPACADHGDHGRGPRQLGPRGGAGRSSSPGLLAPGIAQILFTFAVRDAGASRTSVTVGTAPLFAVATALVFLDEPLVAGLLLGAALIVTGGIVLASDRARPEHFKRIGLVYALIGTIAFATRDTVIRWLGTEATDAEPGTAAFVAMLTGTAVSLAFLAWTRTPLTRRARRRVRARGALLRPVVRVPVRGVLARPRVRRLADRRDRVAVGRDAVVARAAQVRAGRPAARSRARRSSSPAAC